MGLLSRSNFRSPVLLWLVLCTSFLLVTTFELPRAKQEFLIPTNIQDDITSSLETPPSASSTQDVTHCGQTLKKLKNGYAAIIESPNYPNNYPPNVDCQWDLEAEKGSIIQATFFDVRIKSPSLVGPSDSLYVTTDGDWGEMQRYSGDLNGVTPFNLLSSSRKMAFRFKSTPTSTGGKGFRIGYYITPRDKPAASEPANGAMGGQFLFSKNMV